MTLRELEAKLFRMKTKQQRLLRRITLLLRKIERKKHRESIKETNSVARSRLDH